MITLNRSQQNALGPIQAVEKNIRKIELFKKPVNNSAIRWILIMSINSKLKTENGHTHEIQCECTSFVFNLSLICVKPLKNKRITFNKIGDHTMYLNHL